MTQVFSFGCPAKLRIRTTLGASGSCLALIAAIQPALPQEVTPVPPVSVTAPAPAAASPAEGSEAAGYKPETVTNFGPFGPTAILNVPYSVHSFSAPLIENLQMSKQDDFIKIDPTLQFNSPSTRSSYPIFWVCGFEPAGSSGRAEDGMVLQNLYLFLLKIGNASMS